MKIFVVYASAGAGHFRAAEAVYNYLKLHQKDIRLELVDVLEKSNILFRSVYTYGYRFLVTYAHSLWGVGFWIAYTRFLRPLIKCMRFVINRLNTRNFADFLIQERPDLIISTHFLPSEVSSYLKRNQKIHSKIITVITDFGVHPFWLSDDTDTYIVASEVTKQRLIFEGVDEDRIKGSGIPIDPKFLKKYDRDILYDEFRLDKDKFTVLIVTGSFGIGPIEEIIDLLYRDIQVLAVCANNKKLYERLNRKNYSNVRVFGLVDNIQELMAVSSLIITKPGGLTISECLAMDLLPIFISSIPGQEAQNLKILSGMGIGIKAKNAYSVKDIVLDFKDHPDKLKSVKEKISRVKKPTATQELCDAVC